MITIQRAVKEDLNKIILLEKEWGKESNYAPEISLKHKKDILNVIKNKRKYIFYIAKIDNKIVGFVYGMLINAKDQIPAFNIKTGEKYGVINEIYVKKSYRGKGIGKKFIKEIISNFKKIGVKRVRITAGSENLDKLVKYYESIGFHRKTTNLVFSIN